MIKKTFILLGVMGLIQLMITACCPDLDPYYNRIRDLEFSSCNLRTKLEDSSTVSQDNFRIRLFIQSERVVQLFNPSFLINSAYATSCPSNYAGLKSDIIDFKITCNKDVFNIKAGQSIDYSKISVYKIGFTEDSKNQRLTIAEWLDKLNDGKRQSYFQFEWYFEFNEPLKKNDYLKFKILIKQEDGSVFKDETNSINVQ